MFKILSVVCVLVLAATANDLKLPLEVLGFAIQMVVNSTI